MKQIICGSYKFNIREDATDERTAREVKPYFKSITLCKEDVWLDIGMQIGLFSVQIADRVQKVIGYEPDIENFNLALDNIKLNNHNNILTFNRAVVGNDDTSRYFYLSTSKSKGIHSFVVKRGRNKTMVETENINKIIKEHSVNKIKMDCEGAEYEILKAMDFAPIKEMVFEYHFNYLRDKDFILYKEIIKLLKQNFSVVEYNENPGKNWVGMVRCKK